MKVSPPIQFRIEWAGSQGMSPLLGSRPILILVLHRPSSIYGLTRRSNPVMEPRPIPTRIAPEMRRNVP